jgi:hypothetical protein
VAPPHEPHGRAVSGSERLYRALLAAYPKEFRRAHGREMAQVFRCMCREEVVSSGSRGLERVMNLGKSRIEMRISRSAWSPRDLRFPHS